MNRWMLLVLISLGFSTTAGCGGGANFQSWQRGVERYIQVNGGGDPTVLRDVKLPDGRRGFAVLGGADPRESTDASAVLLGHEAVHGKPQFIYLVGIVSKLVVTDIRLATLAVENGKYSWAIGKRDDEATKTYRAFHDRVVRERHAGVDGAASMRRIEVFPDPADRFELNITDQGVVATHRESGARWELLTSTKAR